MVPNLSKEDISIICNILSRYPSIQEAFFFGSRAKGTQKKGSDIDIAIKGASTDLIVASVSGELNDETSLPYIFDVVAFEALEHLGLKEHIQRVGVLFYSKENFTGV